ncbi:MAG: PIN domain-containing protein [Caldilineaceae bacterium]|nr:PIN domain-containing protein [Caldilineaceae bacterium]MBP8108875.1 PIN domain-containing protein [Caldilineaceae bacterium]MBP8124815.1 PIN domain-containing protein [Caldilineaceae bacterium]MBP9074450.1 PIN domain-containing protein [Caldilineaceae bacterium]
MSELLVDTNILWQHSLRNRLTEHIRSGQLRVYVPTIIHAERVRQLADSKGETFAIDVVRQAVAQSKFNLLPFTTDDAEALADLWRDLKSAVEPAIDANDYWRRNSIDILLCAVARSRGFTLVTDDRGQHFDLLVPERLHTGELESWLVSLDDE